MITGAQESIQKQLDEADARVAAKEQQLEEQEGVHRVSQSHKVRSLRPKRSVWGMSKRMGSGAGSLLRVRSRRDG